MTRGHIEEGTPGLSIKYLPFQFSLGRIQPSEKVATLIRLSKLKRKKVSPSLTSGCSWSSCWIFFWCGNFRRTSLVSDKTIGLGSLSIRIIWSRSWALIDLSGNLRTWRLGQCRICSKSLENGKSPQSTEQPISSFSNERFFLNPLTTFPVLRYPLAPMFSLL